MLAAAVVVAAQETPEPTTELTPFPVYPLCDRAFAKVAADAEAASPSPSSGPSPGRSPLPSPSLAPSAGDDPNALPHGPVQPLDQAIRSCSSIEEFVAAAARYPASLGGLDAMQFVLDRCSDKDAGLAGYATCSSLERALATPTPRPTPSPSPEATISPSDRRKSGWNARTAQVAERYLESARQAYSVDLPHYSAYLRYYDWTAPQLTAAERKAVRAQGDLLRDRAVAVIRRHRKVMDRDDPARCFRDAYEADRRIAKRWIRQLETGVYGGTETAPGRAASETYDKLDQATADFIERRVTEFFDDCR